MLRIAREDIQRKLFLRRIFYTGIRRDWIRGSRAIFVKRLESGDAFVGSGVIEQFIPSNDLNEQERKVCAARNWYGKIVFDIVTRFLPAVAANQCGNLPVLQTGQQMSVADTEKISALVQTRITS